MPERPAFIFWIVYFSLALTLVFGVHGPRSLSLAGLAEDVGWALVGTIIVAPFAHGGALVMLAAGDYLRGILKRVTERQPRPES